MTLIIILNGAISIATYYYYYTCSENRKAGIPQHKPINDKVKQEKHKVRTENTMKSFGMYSYFGGFVASTGCKMNGA